jgi:Glycosyl transferase family 90
MAPVFTKTSWGMEELLTPWVHYILLLDDMSDTEEKIQWIINHDQLAQTIAYNGELWITDLMYHLDADRDDEQIYDEIVRWYISHFQKVTNVSLAI